MSSNKIDLAELKQIVFKRASTIILILGALIFIPAWTIFYWQAWVYIGVLVILATYTLIYLFKHDPELLERRMKFREKEKEQKKLIKVLYIFFLLAYIIPGLDVHFGWSNVPIAIVLVADLIAFLGYVLVILVFRENSYTSRVIEVAKGQKVISTGPYAVIRHPMYLGSLLLYCLSPLALGSYWGLLPTLPIIIGIIFRILNEEKVLAKNLPGYTEYMIKVRYRLLPEIW